VELAPSNTTVGWVPVMMTVALLLGASVIISLLKQMPREWFRKLEPRFRMSYETVADDLARADRDIVLTLNSGNLGRRPRWDLDRPGQHHGGRRRLRGDLDDGQQCDRQLLHRDMEAVSSRQHRGNTIEVLPENLKGRVADSNLMFVTVREDT
jgi:hypothetical protein